MSALVRTVEAAGGFAMILRRGDAERGGILLQTLEKGVFTGFLERVNDGFGPVRIIPCGPAIDGQAIEIQDYIEKRRRTDPDLWVVELDIANAERFAVETIAVD